MKSAVSSPIYKRRMFECIQRVYIVGQILRIYVADDEEEESENETEKIYRKLIAKE